VLISSPSAILIKIAQPTLTIIELKKVPTAFFCLILQKLGTLHKIFKNWLGLQLLRAINRSSWS
jgi:hypothetical protein